MNDKELTHAIGQQIRALRLGKGMTQEELSKIFDGIGRTTIAEWERGTHAPSITALIRLADFFEVSIHDLIDGIAAQPSSSASERAITFSGLLQVLDAKYAALLLDLSPTLKARIDLDLGNSEQVEDAVQEYGNCPVTLLQFRSIKDQGLTVIEIDCKSKA